MNRLYTTDSCTPCEGGADFRLTLNAAHPIFQGHFPGRPVLPGVCSIALIKDCAERLIGRSTGLTYIQSCKFIRSIDPNTDKHIRLSVRLAEGETAGTRTVTAEGFAGDECFIRLKGRLTDSPQ